MRDIPDFKTEFSQVVDYIMSSDLAKKAFISPPFENYVNIIIETLNAIDRLADNCHMPEFTNHALPHICSVVKRASEWSVNDKWIDTISSKEAGYLLLSLIIHDLGMLSQDPNHLPDNEKINAQKGLSDVSSWVRKTHVSRLDKLYRSLISPLFNKNEESLTLVIQMAASHSIWPWDKKFDVSEELCQNLGVDKNNIISLCAIIAVSDLLDEDSNRCDTVTLIKHKQGTVENIAHWIRHALTVNVSSVESHTINVNFRKLTNLPEGFEIIYRALRNHYKLIKAYNGVLKSINAEITNINFSPSDGIPEYMDEISENLYIWENIDEFKYNLTDRIFSTFMPETKGIYYDFETEKNILKLGLESIVYTKTENYLLTLEEDVISKANEKNELNILNYLYRKAETEYLNGNIGSVRYFCSLAIETIDNSKQKIQLSDVYWIFSFMFDCFRKQMDFDSIKKIYGREDVLPKSITINNYKEKGSIYKNYKSYQALLDFLFDLYDYEFDHDNIIKHIEMCKTIDVNELNNDLPTAVIFEKIADILFFLDEKILALQFLNNFISKIGDNNKSVLQMLKDVSTRLTWHKFVFEKNSFVLPEKINNIEEIFAYTWRSFYDHSWNNLEVCLNELIKQVNSKSPYYISVVGFYNMFSQRISLQNHNDFPILKQSSYQKYQRLESENPRAAYISELCGEVDNLLLEIRKNPINSSSQRGRIMRYVIHLESISRKYWDLGLYIESNGYLAELAYSLSTYRNERNIYSGLPEWCDSCIINSIKSLDHKLLSEENKKELIGIMECNKKEDIDNVYSYIFEESKEAEWFDCVEWLNLLKTNLPKKKLKDLIQWSLKFLDLSERTKYRFDYKCWNYLTSIILHYKLTSEEWRKLDPIIKKVLNDPFMASSCYSLCYALLIKMPKSHCVNYLRGFSNIFTEESKLTQDFIRLIYNLSIEREDIAEEGKKVLELLCKKSNENLPYYLNNPKVDMREFDENEVREHIASNLKSLTPIKGMYSAYGDMSFYYKNINWSKASENVFDGIYIMFEDFFEKNQKDICEDYFKKAFDILTTIAIRAPIKYQKQHLEYTLKLIETDYQTDTNISDRIMSSPMQSFRINIANGTKHEAFLIALCELSRVGNEKQIKSILKWLISTFPNSTNKNLYYYTYLFGFLYLNSTKTNKQLAFVGIMMLKAMCSSNNDVFHYAYLLEGIHHLLIHSSDKSKKMLKKFYLKSNIEYREFVVWSISKFFNSNNYNERHSCAELIKVLTNSTQYSMIPEIEDMKIALMNDSRKSIRGIFGNE